MGAATSGWSITSVDIPVAEAAQHANGIEDLYNGALDVRDADEVGWARPNQKNPADDIRMLGMPATPTYASPTGPSPEAYFEQAEWTRNNAPRIFGGEWDAVSAIEGMLTRFSGGRPRR